MIALRKIESWNDYLPELIFSHPGLRIEDYAVDAVATGLMNLVGMLKVKPGIKCLT